MQLEVAALVVLLGVLPALIFTLLFGQARFFAGTPLPRLHWLVTQGARDAVRWAAAQLPGAHAGGCTWLARLEELCCERSNPAVQVFFAVLLGACYWVYVREVFSMLPLPGVPGWHLYTGSAATLVVTALFAAASLSDPGTVTATNAAAFDALYPHDGLLFTPRHCDTCRLPKPARSKHCRACGRCVARYDHHCIWINNCVGLCNARVFMLFLVSTAALCFYGEPRQPAYGAAVGVAVLRADMAARDAWSMAYVPRGGSGRMVYLGDSWVALGRYLLAFYPPQATLTAFLAMAGWIVTGFTGYQLWLAASGTTANEVGRRADLRAAVRDARRNGGSSSVSGSVPPWLSDVAAGLRRNPYDRGALRNLSEVLLPARHLAAAAAPRKDS